MRDRAGLHSVEDRGVLRLRFLGVRGCMGVRVPRAGGGGGGRRPVQRIMCGSGVRPVGEVQRALYG